MFLLKYILEKIYHLHLKFLSITFMKASDSDSLLLLSLICLLYIFDCIAKINYCGLKNNFE